MQDEQDKVSAMVDEIIGDTHAYDQLAEQVEALGNAMVKISEVVKQHDAVLVSLSKSMKDLKDTIEEVRRPKIIY